MSSGYTIVHEESTVIVDTDEGLEVLLRRHLCKSIEDLEQLFWYNYGITLIDKRKK